MGVCVCVYLHFCNIGFCYRKGVIINDEVKYCIGGTTAKLLGAIWACSVSLDAEGVKGGKE